MSCSVDELEVPKHAKRMQKSSPRRALREPTHADLFAEAGSSSDQLYALYAEELGYGLAEAAQAEAHEVIKRVSAPSIGDFPTFLFHDRESVGDEKSDKALKRPVQIPAHLQSQMGLAAAAVFVAAAVGIAAGAALIAYALRPNPTPRPQ